MRQVRAVEERGKVEGWGSPGVEGRRGVGVKRYGRARIQ